MSSTLTFFTPRSGSTYINDLLSIQNGNLNLDEFLHSKLRGNFFNRLPRQVANIIAPINDKTLTRTTRESWLAASKLYNEKVDIVKLINKQYGVSLKEVSQHAIRNLDGLFNYCIDNNFKIIFVYRENIYDQVYSFLCSRIRHEMAKTRNIPDDTCYLNFKNSPQVFGQVRVKFDMDHALINLSNIVKMSETWLAHYSKYKKHATLVSYEQIVVNKQYKALDISDNIVDNYQKLNDSVIPFDIGTTGSMIANWDDIRPYIDYYNSMYINLKDEV